MGFQVTHAANGQKTYPYKSPRWMRWDSNRVVMRELEGGDLYATIPLYVYTRLQARNPHA